MRQEEAEVMIQRALPQRPPKETAKAEKEGV
jgi:hypothetical protein